MADILVRLWKKIWKDLTLLVSKCQPSMFVMINQKAWLLTNSDGHSLLTTSRQLRPPLKIIFAIFDTKCLLESWDQFDHFLWAHLTSAPSCRPHLVKSLTTWDWNLPSRPRYLEEFLIVSRELNHTVPARHRYSQQWNSIFISDKTRPDQRRGEERRGEVQIWRSDRV